MGRADGQRGRMRGVSPGGRARAPGRRLREASRAPFGLSELRAGGTSRPAPLLSSPQPPWPCLRLAGRPLNSRDDLVQPLGGSPDVQAKPVPRSGIPTSRRTDSHSPRVTDVHLRRYHLQPINTLYCQSRHSCLETQTTPHYTQIPRLHPKHKHLKSYRSLDSQTLLNTHNVRKHSKSLTPQVTVDAPTHIHPQTRLSNTPQSRTCPVSSHV